MNTSIAARQCCSAMLLCAKAEEVLYAGHPDSYSVAGRKLLSTQRSSFFVHRKLIQQLRERFNLLHRSASLICCIAVPAEPQDSRSTCEGLAFTSKRPSSSSYGKTAQFLLQHHHPLIQSFVSL